VIPLDEEMTHNRATADQGAGARRGTGDTSAALVCVRIDVMRRYLVAQAKTGRPGMAPMGVAQEFARVFLAAKYTAGGWFSAPTLRGSVSRGIVLRVDDVACARAGPARSDSGSIAKTDTCRGAMLALGCTKLPNPEGSPRRRLRSPVENLRDTRSATPKTALNSRKGAQGRPAERHRSSAGPIRLSPWPTVGS
jgi:hypothetical protein